MKESTEDVTALERVLNGPRPHVEAFFGSDQTKVLGLIYKGFGYAMVRHALSDEQWTDVLQRFTWISKYDAETLVTIGRRFKYDEYYWRFLQSVAGETGPLEPCSDVATQLDELRKQGVRINNSGALFKWARRQSCLT
jgi:hypothetical protein